MILVLAAATPVAEGVAQGLELAGREVTRDVTTDVGSMAAVRSAVEAARPDAVVLVEGLDDRVVCERDPDRAFLLNSEALIHLAAAGREFSATPVMISTAEVFGGRGGPWGESDEPSPRSVWARSKLKGETFLTRAAPDSVVLRTGPMIGVDLTRERGLMSEPTEAADDELVSPVSAKDVGRAIHSLLRGQASGVFHMGGEETTRAELAMAIGEALGQPGRVTPTPGRRISGGPPRARNATLLADKLRRYHDDILTPWRDAVAEAAAATQAKPSASAEEEQVMGHPQEVRRVDKPWGHEIIWAHTERYVGKVLFVKAGERLSLQYHEAKDETVYVMSGKMVFEVGPRDQEREDRIMKAGDSYHITPHTVHRMIAIEDTTILEASTPELDDVVRLEDKYGRQGTSAP